MTHLWQLFWMFLKINFLSTSGPASVGLLYEEAVGKLMTESKFVEAVGFSSVLPGSDALQLAMFVGYAAGGIPGVLVALVGSILPPTILMFGIITILTRLSGEVWLSGFMRGLTPAVAALMVFVAWKVFQGDEQVISPISIGIAAATILALTLKVPAPLVLLAAGLAGIILFR